MVKRALSEIQSSPVRPLSAINGSAGKSSKSCLKPLSLAKKPVRRPLDARERDQYIQDLFTNSKPVDQNPVGDINPFCMGSLSASLKETPVFRSLNSTPIEIGLVETPAFDRKFKKLTEEERSQVKHLTVAYISNLLCR